MDVIAMRIPRPKPRQEHRKPAMFDELFTQVAAVFDRFATAFTVLGAATLGRLMYHADQVKRGKRAFWSFVLVMDLIIAAGMGLVSWGLCVWAKIDGPAQAALIAVAGYLGPHIIDVWYAQKQGQSTPAQPASDAADTRPQSEA
jgi:LydA holin phage, holin superfamily III